MKNSTRFFIVLIAVFVLLGMYTEVAVAECDTDAGESCSGERSISLEHHCEASSNGAYCVQKWVQPDPQTVTCPDLTACSYSFTIYGVKCADDAQPSSCPETDVTHSDGCCVNPDDDDDDDGGGQTCGCGTQECDTSIKGCRCCNNGCRIGGCSSEDKGCAAYTCGGGG